MGIFFVLLLFFAPLLIMYGAYQYHLFEEGTAFYFNRIKWNTKISRQEYLKVDSVLNRRISFYRKLSNDGRAKFVHRLQRLLLIKKFVEKDDLTLTHEMKIVVCAAMVQITYGMKRYELDNIKGFEIYPSIFYNRFMKVYLKGSTPPEGLISLSWKDLEHGFLIDNDKYNLGLHEVAHALKLSLKYAYNFDTKFANYLETWESIGYKEFDKMKRGNDSFLRKYGGVNEHEFFAVCIEHFFEVPKEFKEHLPKIYHHLCILLNLNPLNTKQDYLLAIKKSSL